MKIRLLAICLMTATSVFNSGVFGTPMGFGKMVRSVSKLRLSQLDGYGSYCGFLGSGQPVDNIDRCCRAHDMCLKRANRKYCLPLFYLAFYVIPYRWRVFNTNIICSNSNSRCQRGLCDCDGYAAECFAKYEDEYNIAFKKRKRFSMG